MGDPGSRSDFGRIEVGRCRALIGGANGGREESKKMRIHSVVLLVLLILMVTFGWLVGRTSSPKAVALLMGIAIGVIVTTPISLLIAAYVWSPRRGVMTDAGIDLRRRHVLPPEPVEFLGTPDRASPTHLWHPTDEEIPDCPPPALAVRYLGE